MSLNEAWLFRKKKKHEFKKFVVVVLIFVN